MSASSTSHNFGQWKILVICPNTKLSGELTPLLAEHVPFSPVIELKDYPTRALLGDALQEQGINLCFVDVETNREWALALLSDLSMLDAKLPIVALHAGNDSEFILRTLRQGATEFLFQPLTAEHFISAMERLSAQHRGKGQASAKVYCVMPAKGACGASTIACNLAHYYRKLGAKKVLLADLDPLTGTISFQLKLKQNYSFMEALTRGGQLDEDIWKGMVQSAGGVDVALAPDQPVHGIDENYNAAAIVDFARSMYEVVILDCNGAYGQWSLTLARLCDELLLVTTNELPALQATQRSLAYLDRNRVDRSKVRILVNRYHKDIGLSRDVIEAALHCDVYHLIPSDYEDVQKALVEGKPIPPGAAVGRSLMSLAEKLSGKEATSVAPKTSSLSSLFSFLRK
ncbi:AAA family ATPase [Paludibaculum fermentans]|uniref:AAA family ATPase n=1 Tax=Paludibaculum fermentans TaxID=1473598 RepID=UPI003EB8B5E7